MTEDSDKLAALFERLADESAQREDTLRKLVERVSSQPAQSQQEHDAELVVDALKRDTGIDLRAPEDN